MRRLAAAALVLIALSIFAISTGRIEFSAPPSSVPTPPEESDWESTEPSPGAPASVSRKEPVRVAVHSAADADDPANPTAGAALPQNHSEPDCDFPFVETQPMSESDRYDLFTGTSENSTWSSMMEPCLGFFVSEQRADGSWEGNVQTTGLVLLTFLGEGETHRGGSYTRTIREGLRWLVSRQSTDGWFTTERDPAGQAIATLIMCDTWCTTARERFKEAARKGLACLETLGPGPDPATWWMLLAQKSAKSGKIQDCIPGFENAMDVVIPNDRSRTPGASWGADPGARILARILLGQDPQRTKEIQDLADKCLQKLPVWKDPLVDPGAWFFKSMGLFQVGGKHWKKWSIPLRKILETTRTELEDGSGYWESASPRARLIGRIETTALMTLCRQMYYGGARMPGFQR